MAGQVAVGNRTWLQSWAATLLQLGLSGYSGRTRRRLETLNALAYLIAVLSAHYAVVYAIEDARAYAPIIAINLALVTLGFVVPLSHRLHELAGALIIAGAEIAALFGLVAVVGRHSGIQLIYFVGAAAPFLIFGPQRRGLIVIMVTLSCGLHLGVWFAFPPERALITVSESFAAQLYVSSAFTAFAVIAALVWYAFARVERAEAETEDLLRKILPGAIVDRLRAAPHATVADDYPAASILFADLRGFVALSHELGAPATVALLNDLMTALDALAVHHGVERIKTVGDAYMAVAGVPIPTPDHATRVAEMALAIPSIVERIGQKHGVDLAMRVGLSCGPVMAGIIGQDKFTYDVWGDCVNLAARLQAAAAPGQVHISREMAAALQGKVPLARLGPSEIKGLGTQETWCFANQDD
jgi:adenylate cyclase